jgi:hypothetical protein
MTPEMQRGREIDRPHLDPARHAHTTEGYDTVATDRSAIAALARLDARSDEIDLERRRLLSDVTANRDKPLAGAFEVILRRTTDVLAAGPDCEPVGVTDALAVAWAACIDVNRSRVRDRPRMRAARILIDAAPEMARRRHR